VLPVGAVPLTVASYTMEHGGGGGWSTFDPFGKNARVTFLLPNPVTVQAVTAWVDNGLTGGVSLPKLIWVSGDGFLSETSFGIAADTVSPERAGTLFRA
jgi:hypothetical protein